MPKLVGLQLLRAFAAILVLLGHAIAEAEHYFALSLHLHFVPWTRGVDIFFVISGFIITLSAKRFPGQPIAFLWRRSLRVVPLYYFFTTLMVIVLLVLPSGPKETTYDFNHILSSYFFFPYARHDGRIAPILSLGWTLNYEMAFYALCALSLMFRNTTRILCILLLSIVFTGIIIPLNTTPLQFWSNPIILEFLYGIVLAKAYQNGWHRKNTKAALVVFALGLVALVVLEATDLPRFIAAGLPALAIVAACTLFCPDFKSNWQILGDASYALYLSHRFTLRLVTLLLIPILPASWAGAWLYVGAVCGLSLVIALLVHVGLERPLLRRNNRHVLA